MLGSTGKLEVIGCKGIPIMTEPGSAGLGSQMCALGTPTSTGLLKSLSSNLFACTFNKYLFRFGGTNLRPPQPIGAITYFGPWLYCGYI